MSVSHGGEPGLRSLGGTHSDATTPPLDGLAATSAPGLATMHTLLDRVVDRLGLRSLTVVVDDPDLGRQAFRAGPGPFEPGALTGEPGCRSDPPLAPDRLEGELLVALCAASLRVDVLRGDAAPGVDAAEIALRRVPGVVAVVVERDDDLLIVEVHVGPDAAADVTRAAARAAAPLGDGSVVVEIVRTITGDSPAPTLPDAATPEPVAAEPMPAVAVSTAPEVAPQVPASVAAPPVTAPTAPTPVIVAVRSAPESGEIEVHVRHRNVRTVGRAPMAQGLAGAAEATLDALRQHDTEIDLGIAWARTIETTADRRFVVAVALHHTGTRATRHGLGTGSSAIEGAARAALDAAVNADENR